MTKWTWLVVGCFIAAACAACTGHDEHIGKLEPQELALGSSGATQIRLVARADEWSFRDTGEDLEEGWRTLDANERATNGWGAGDAPLGYGETYLHTILSFGEDPADRPTTTYFVKDVELPPDNQDIESLFLRVNFDDGFVFYLDGHEGGYAFMPSMAVDYETSALGHEAKNRYYTYDISTQIPHLLDKAGPIQLAFELHQESSDSEDLVFDAELLAWIDGADRQAAVTTDGIPFGSAWTFWDTGEAPAGWKQTSFDDAGWSMGEAPLGFGEYNLVTNTQPGGMTLYARHAFELSEIDPADVTQVVARVLYDDGYVVYLNGVEVGRRNMPSGPVTYDTPAAGWREDKPPAQHPGDDSHERDWLIGAEQNLVAGTNVLAVEVHQWSASSSDIVFDLGLVIESEVDEPDDLTPLGPSWQQPAPISSHSFVTELSLGMDNAGRAVAVWNAERAVLSSRYDPTGGWGPVERVDDPAVDDDAINPTFVMNGAGQGLAAWTKRDSYTDVHVRSYDPINGWVTSPLEHASSTQFRELSADINASGQVVLAAESWILGPTVAAIYSPGTGWNGPLVEVGGVGQSASRNRQVRISDAGTAVVTWTQRTSTSDPHGELAVSVYSPANGSWSAPAVLSNDAGANVGPPQVSIVTTSEGEDIRVAWTQHDEDGDTAWMTRRRPDMGWESPSMIPTPLGVEVSSLRMVASADGGVNALVFVGSEHGLDSLEGAERNQLWGQLAGADLAWQPALLIEERASASIDQPRVAMNDAGQAIAGWMVNDDLHLDLQTSRLDPLGGWGAAEYAEDIADSCEAPPAIAINALGEVGAAWVIRVSNPFGENVWANFTL